MFIVGLGTALPPKCYSQQECWDALNRAPMFPAFSTRARAILRKVLLGNNGIATRHLVLDPLDEAFQTDPDTLHQRFLKNAPMLAEEAVKNALADAAMDIKKVDAIIVCTCTGYVCPGLSSYVMELLGLAPEVFCLDLVGQGCGAAMPGLNTAMNLVASGKYGTVVTVCVEVCSAAFYLDEDPGVLVSACLFGDGAAAAVVSAEDCQPAYSVKWKEFGSITDVTTRDLLRFEQKGGMLRNILSLQVPALAANYAQKVLDQVNANPPRPISNYVLHAGGRDVLKALEKKLGLSEAQTLEAPRSCATWEILAVPLFSLYCRKRFEIDVRPACGGWLRSALDSPPTVPYWKYIININTAFTRSDLAPSIGHKRFPEFSTDHCGYASNFGKTFLLQYLMQSHLL